MAVASREEALFDDEASFGDGGAHATHHWSTVVGRVHRSTRQRGAIDTPVTSRVKDRDVRVVPDGHYAAVCTVSHAAVLTAQLRDARRSTAQHGEENSGIGRRAERLEGQ